MLWDAGYGKTLLLGLVEHEVPGGVDRVHLELLVLPQSEVIRAIVLEHSPYLKHGL